MKSSLFLIKTVIPAISHFLAEMCIYPGQGPRGGCLTMANNPPGRVKPE